MKKAVCGIIAAFFVLIAVSAVKSPEKSKELTVQNVVSVENSAESSALVARFLNMLNHNYIYDSQFDDVEEIINGSTPALLNLREDEYIAEHHVADYIYNMYGIEIFDMSELNSQFPKKSGYMYILPKGYDTYKHSIKSSTQNEDGTYTVITKLKIFDQYGEVNEKTAKSLFVKNEASDFGYNIVYSEIM